ncbi:MAG: alpha/beta hydrolase [Xanthobacteraceae bacterium]
MILTGLKWTLVFALTGYAALVALMYLTQRSLLYFPDVRRTPPADAGLPQAEEVLLQSADGERLIAWHLPPRGDKPVVVYFQGNGGALDLRAQRFREITADGTGLLALCYRGYGGSSGSPSEAGLIRDALAAHGFAAARYGAGRIVLWGESLGTAVAVALASEKPVARLVLESPFTSIADLAAAIYWYVPVRWLIKDAFRSDLRIGKVAAPVLVVHGARDTIIPIGFGERLYALIRAPKRFIRLPDAGHNDHDSHSLPELVRAFVLGDERL